MGLSARLYAEMPDDRMPLQPDETYFLMPCEDQTLRPVRMKSERILTLEEFRMSHLTSMRMMHKLRGIGPLMDEVHRKVLGPKSWPRSHSSFSRMLEKKCSYRSFTVAARKC